MCGTPLHVQIATQLLSTQPIVNNSTNHFYIKHAIGNDEYSKSHKDFRLFSLFFVDCVGLCRSVMTVVESFVIELLVWLSCSLNQFYCFGQGTKCDFCTM